MSLNHKKYSLLFLLILVAIPVVSAENIIPQTDETYEEKYQQDVYVEGYYTPVLESRYCEEDCKREDQIENSCINPYCCLDQSNFFYEARCSTGGFIDGEFYRAIDLRPNKEKEVVGNPQETTKGINENGNERRVNRTVSVHRDPSSPCHLPLGSTVTIQKEDEFNRYIVEDYHEEDIGSSACLIKIFRGVQGEQENRQQAQNTYITNIEETVDEERTETKGSIQGAYYYRKDITSTITFVSAVQDTLNSSQDCEDKETRGEKERCLQDLFESNSIDDGFYCEDVDPIDQPVGTGEEEVIEDQEIPEEDRILPEPEEIPEPDVENVGPRLIDQSQTIENKQRFWNEIQALAERLNTNPHYLPIIMLTETGVQGRIDHTVINDRGCVGLIQFCPWGGLQTINQSTERSITAQTVSEMQAVEQLEYVEIYLENVIPSNRQEYIDLETLYLYVLYPSEANAEPTKILNPHQGHALSDQSRHLYAPDGTMTKLSIRRGLLSQAGVDGVNEIPVPTRTQEEVPLADPSPMIDSPVFDISQYSEDQIRRITEEHILRVASCIEAQEDRCVCEAGIIPPAEFTSTYVLPQTTSTGLPEFIPHNIPFRNGLNLLTTANRNIIPMIREIFQPQNNPETVLQSILSGHTDTQIDGYETILNRESYYYIKDGEAYFLPQQPTWYNETRQESVLNILQEKDEDVGKENLIQTCQPEKHYFTYCAYPPTRDGVRTQPITYTLQI